MMFLSRKLLAAMRDAYADAIAASVDAGDGPGVLTIWTGPPDTENTNGQVCLATYTFSKPAFSKAKDGVARAYPLTQVTDNDGTASRRYGEAGHFRIHNSKGDCICQGSVGVNQGELRLNTVGLFADSPGTIYSFAIKSPKVSNDET